MSAQLEMFQNIDSPPKDKFSKGEKIPLIGKFLSPEVKDVDWKREVAVFNTLLRRYPSPTFWRAFSINYKIKSIIWFVGEGKKEVDTAYNLFLLDWKSKERIIENTKKLGEDIVSKTKPSLRDILRN